MIVQTVNSADDEPAVLVVDDDVLLLRLVVAALERAGFVAIEAKSGEEALGLVNTKPVSIVVSDLGLPGMSGIELVRELRRRPESTTTPFLLMTGTGDDDTVIEALQAGADDFVAKPVRMDELVARVVAHHRTRAAWTDVVEIELSKRAEIVRAIGRLQVTSDPEEVAAEVVGELARRAGSAYVDVLQVLPGARLAPLARFSHEAGLTRGGAELSRPRARDLIRRSADGPWTEFAPRPGPNEPLDQFWAAQLDVVVGAPIFAGSDLIAILTIGARARTSGPTLVATRSTLLASAIDFAGVLGAVATPAIALRRTVDIERTRLKGILARGAFHPVFQRIVELETGRIVGFEALTRFEDGTAPDVRFSEANEAGLALDFELAAVQAAMARATPLPDDVFLSVNLSPRVITQAGTRLARLFRSSARRPVVEITEHEPITDYPSLRRGIARLGGVDISIDDTGAGYASMRHILELRPAFAKLDRSLVQAIDSDPVRRALAAGLAHFAVETGFKLIAEGIERKEEAIVLLDLGVGLGQGYFFGGPVEDPLQ